MISLGLFAFFCGVHLAWLQFNYFYLLLLNMTSTYITYVVVVVSWMIGTLIGLWWKWLNPNVAIMVGLVSYYAVFGLLKNVALASFAFPLVALGVAITGLWAGRFFLVTLPLFGRADRLFFHENNGFILGIILAFTGFTLLGYVSLLWPPILSGIGLMIHYNWLHSHQCPPQTVSLNG